MNKVALGIAVTNEINFLKRHLPILKKCFDGVYVSDGGSTDGSLEYLKEAGIYLIQGDFGHGLEWKEANHKNSVVLDAEKAGYDWIVSLDADEIMYPKDIAVAKKFMTSDNNFLRFPRIEFFGDTKHFKPHLYPDLQGRAFRLHAGYHWRKDMHSVVYQGENQLSCSEMGDYTIVPTAPIFHYGWALAMKERMNRYYPGRGAFDYLNDPTVKVYGGPQPV